MRKERLKPYATAGLAGILGLTILSGCTGGGNPDAGVNRGPSPDAASTQYQGPEGACEGSMYRFKVLGTLILSQDQKNNVFKGQLPEGLEPLKKTAAEATLFRYVLDASDPPTLPQAHNLDAASTQIRRKLGMPDWHVSQSVYAISDEDTQRLNNFDVRPGEIAIQIGKDADTQCRDGSPLPLPGTSSPGIATQPGLAV